jgi:molybdopterin-guanine dinucleotide biosynthesis protein A
MEERLFEGFVLTGGRSSRMGRDKALLPVDRSTLVEQVAARVRAVAGSVTLIGAPERYTGLGLPVAADLIEGCGPIGGVYTALRISSAAWNLLTAGFLAQLLEGAQEADADCFVPKTASGLHPLCAVYHRLTLPAVEYAIDHKSFKMHDLLDSLRTVSWPVADVSLLENVNTPIEWSSR